MSEYVIRVQAFEGYEEKIKGMHERFTRVLAVYHTGKMMNNPHYHVIVETTEKMENVRKIMKKVFDGGSGNGHMSMKKFDGERKGYAYMWHESDRETFKVVARRGHTDEQIEGYRKHHEEVLKVISENTPIKIVERAVQVLKTAQPNKKGGYSKQQICDVIWDDLRTRGEWFPNSYVLKRWVMRVECLCTRNEKEWENLKRMWFGEVYGFEYIDN